KPRISAEKHFAVTIHHLAHDLSYRNIGHLYGIGESTSLEVISRTLGNINATLYPDVVYFLGTDEEWAIKRGHFHELSRMPNVARAIDDSFVPVQKPTGYARANGEHGDPKLWYCRKKFYAVILRGIVDAKATSSRRTSHPKA
ncbi:hypothetical protein BDK51DRAFT_33862, partial [Blyttiomyces helicus]